MIILIYYLLLGYTIVSSIKSQWLSSDSFQSRLSFPCTNGTFNCGNGVCISLNKIQDEVIDCFDGSDEFCFPGYIKCGSKCVEFIYAGDCLKHPDCDDPIQSPPFCAYLKKKLCAFNDTIKCRGYGECIEKAWLFDNKQDCYDGSDLGNFISFG
uniref:EB domain-containing protein n=1 Tax=Rhabditophanes sp. KR3021 TaxID=114890 RepID=A0AC35U543_9BILA